MYDGDSFFTLTVWGRAGLVAVSLTMAGAWLWVTARLAAGKPLPLRIGIAAVAFFLFVWLSPQGHYLYYMTIFDGLPWQVVVKHPPSVPRLLRLLTFREAATLSAHGTGLLGLALLGTAVLHRGIRN